MDPKASFRCFYHGLACPLREEHYQNIEGLFRSYVEEDKRGRDLAGGEDGGCSEGEVDGGGLRGCTSERPSGCFLSFNV